MEVDRHVRRVQGFPPAIMSVSPDFFPRIQKNLLHVAVEIPT